MATSEPSRWKSVGYADLSAVPGGGQTWARSGQEVGQDLAR